MSRTLLLAATLLICVQQEQSWGQAVPQPPSSASIAVTLTSSGPQALGPEELKSLEPLVSLHPELVGDGFEDRIARVLQQAMQARGYLGAAISITFDPSKPLLSINIVPGPQTLVQTVELKFIGANGEAVPANIEQQLIARLLASDDANNLLNVGKPFTAKAWDAYKAQVLSAAQSRDYLQARLAKHEAHLNADTHQASIVLHVDLGQTVKLGDIRIVGLTRYPAQRVRQISDLLTGQSWDVNALSKAQLALLDTRWFASVTITPRSVAQTGVVDLDIDVLELASQKMTIGLGVHSDLGLRAKFAFDDNSIGSQAWSASLNSTVTQRLQNIEIGLKTAPLSVGTVYGTLAKIEHQKINGESVDALSLSVYHNRRTPTIEAVTSLTWQREQQSAAGQSREILRALVPAWSWNQRQLDDRVNPRKGYTVNTQLSGASDKIGSSATFVRAYARGLWLRPFNDKPTTLDPVLALRGEIGTVATRNENGVPTENLFRTGGSQSIRGYGYQTLGRTQTNASTGETSIVGTRRLLVASAELRVNAQGLVASLPKSLEAAVFYDIGTASQSSSQANFASGLGVGARWRSLVGPINLDLAWSPELSRWRLHFSVGFTF